MKKVLMGNHAAALGAALARVDVVAAYPITPQTQTVEYLAELEAEGAFRGVFLRVESEHSAMSALLGAATAGSRTFTATSSQGLAYMHELLHWVSGARLPVVMVNVCRALAAPWNLWADHTDSMSQRDTGWMQFYCASNQEVLDTVLMAYRVAERTSLPAMVVLDGFTLSHTYEPVDVPGAAAVDAYLPRWTPDAVLDPVRPLTFGSLAGPRDYQRLRRRLAKDMDTAADAVAEAGREFGRAFGRDYGLVEAWGLEDAEVALVTAGSAGSTALAAAQELRREGRKAGALRLRSFRPFPIRELRRLIRPGLRLAVVDRGYSQGSQGIIASELAAALYPRDDRPGIFGFVAGLGGSDITVELLKEIWLEAAGGQADPLAPAWMEDAR